MAELSAQHKRANRLHLAIFDMQDARRYLEAYAELGKLFVLIGWREIDTEFILNIGECNRT
ncbi:hypothetical protein JAB9_51020 [Janthinobacterium sp. HH107]|nr:hypothetical protein JAB9_51020 [Janthinobacterium sp. HH107]